MDAKQPHHTILTGCSTHSCRDSPLAGPGPAFFPRWEACLGAAPKSAACCGNQVFNEEKDGQSLGLR